MGWTADWSALERLVADQLPSALAFAGRLTGDPDSAEEIVQEALLRAVRAWPGFRGESQARTWLFRIIVNVFRDQISRRQPAELPADLPDQRADDPAELAAAIDLGRHVAELVSALPPRQREVLVLVTYEGLSIAETARLLEITEQNVHSNLHAARERLRKQLLPHRVQR
jgi:RNA polymerase sigma-70 factor (ECF subfamily)